MPEETNGSLSRKRTRLTQPPDTPLYPAPTYTDDRLEFFIATGRELPTPAGSRPVRNGLLPATGLE